MKQLSQENLDEIFKQMFNVVGATYSPEIVKQERWYMKYRWTKTQEDGFRKWLVSYLKKNKFCSSKQAGMEAEYFLLWVGFPTSDFDKK